MEQVQETSYTARELTVKGKQQHKTGQTLLIPACIQIVGTILYPENDNKK
jgi:hypothetical protein